MARPLRLEYSGAVYHVTSRGQERAAIFRDDADREGFRKALGVVASDHGWILHAYCLMSNHYHLLLETPAPNLALGMKALNGRYTQKFNRRHRRTGHLLEGRYKSILVQKESHLLELCRYVVLNPVRAGMARGPADWPWSNYRSTAGLAAGPSWLELDWTLSQFGRRREGARRAYRRFVAAGRGVKSPLEKVRNQVFLGDDGFIRRMTRRIGAKREDPEIPMTQRRPWSVGLPAIRRAVATSFGVEEESLSRMRGGQEKISAIYLARKMTGMTGIAIGRAFNVKAARVSNIVRDVESGDRRHLLPRLERLRKRLSSV